MRVEFNVSCSRADLEESTMGWARGRKRVELEERPT